MTEFIECLHSTHLSISADSRDSGKTVTIETVKEAGSPARQEVRLLDTDGYKKPRISPATVTQMIESNPHDKPPDFVVKLYLMMFELSSDLIAWDDGKIIIPGPSSKLEEKILAHYFRHSKFTSFQRQLNNFGFHKSVASSSNKLRVYSREDMTGYGAEAVLDLRRSGGPGCAIFRPGSTTDRNSSTWNCATEKDLRPTEPLAPSPPPAPAVVVSADKTAALPPKKQGDTSITNDTNTLTGICRPRSPTDDARESPPKKIRIDAEYSPRSTTDPLATESLSTFASSSVVKVESPRSTHTANNALENEPLPRVVSTASFTELTVPPPYQKIEQQHRVIAAHSISNISSVASDFFPLPPSRINSKDTFASLETPVPQALNTSSFNPEHEYSSDFFMEFLEKQCCGTVLTNDFSALTKNSDLSLELFVSQDLAAATAAAASLAGVDFATEDISPLFAS